MAITPSITTSLNKGGTAGGSDSDLLIQFNALVANVASLMDNLVADGNVTVSTPTIGSTVTITQPTNVIQINGVPTLLAAESNKAFGALGTIPTATWGIINLERVAAGTTTFVSGAANYTTGYATEALAIAAKPAQSADKVITGYVTILAASPGWVAGTDALAGGSGGTPATTTNYYPGTGLYASAVLTAKKIGNLAGAAISATVQ